MLQESVAKASGLIKKGALLVEVNGVKLLGYTREKIIDSFYQEEEIEESSTLSTPTFKFVSIDRITKKSMYCSEC